MCLATLRHPCERTGGPSQRNRYDGASAAVCTSVSADAAGVARAHEHVLQSRLTPSDTLQLRQTAVERHLATLEPRADAGAGLLATHTVTAATTLRTPNRQARVESVMRHATARSPGRLFLKAQGAQSHLSRRLESSEQEKHGRPLDSPLSKHPEVPLKPERPVKEPHLPRCVTATDAEAAAAGTLRRREVVEPESLHLRHRRRDDAAVRRTRRSGGAEADAREGRHADLLVVDRGGRMSAESHANQRNQTEQAAAHTHLRRREHAESRHGSEAAAAGSSVEEKTLRVRPAKQNLENPRTRLPGCLLPAPAPANSRMKRRRVRGSRHFSRVVPGKAVVSPSF